MNKIKILLIPILIIHMIILEYYHTNVIYIEKNGQVELEKEFTESKETHATDRSLLNVGDIVAFAEMVNIVIAQLLGDLADQLAGALMSGCRADDQGIALAFHISSSSDCVREVAVAAVDEDIAFFKVRKKKSFCYATCTAYFSM